MPWWSGGTPPGEVMFYGRGAGELPTASACVADVMECLQSSARREEIGWSSETDGFEDPAELKTRYYFRIEGSLTDAAMAFGQVEVLSEDGRDRLFDRFHQRHGRPAGSPAFSTFWPVCGSWPDLQHPTTCV